MSESDPFDPEGFDSSGLEQPRRKHRATGNPRGGKRDGAGRPEGSTNDLEYGEVKALKTLRWRVPENVPAEVSQVADEAMGQIVEVMRGNVPSFMGHASAVLKAAAMVREEVCGPLKQRIEVGHADMTDEHLAKRFAEITGLRPPDSEGGET